MLQWDQMRELALTRYAMACVSMKIMLEGTITAQREGAREALGVEGKFAIQVSNPSNRVTHEHLLISLNGHHIQWTSDGKTCSLSLDGSMSSGCVGRLPEIEIVLGAAKWQVIRSLRSGVMGNSILAEIRRDNGVLAVFRMLPTRTSWLVRKLKELSGRPVVNAGYPKMFLEVNDLEPGIMASQATAIALALVFRTIVLEHVTFSLIGY